MRGRKWAYFDSLSTTTKIVVLQLESGNPSMKSIEISSQIWERMGRGCNNPIEAKFSCLCHWHVLHPWINYLNCFDILESFYLHFMSTTMKSIDNGRCKFGFGCKKKKWSLNKITPSTTYQGSIVLPCWILEYNAWRFGFVATSFFLASMQIW